MTLKIDTVLCRAGIMDNYSYIIVDEETGVSAVIDPSETKPIEEELKRLNLRPEFILNTHHHFDHTEGNLELKKMYDAKLVIPQEERNKINGGDVFVSDGEIFYVGGTKAEVISAKGHTQGHILWYFPNDKVIFTGDVLFNLCIGGLFEGTPEEMWESLQKIKKLPDDVVFYPGHEYTMHAINFALSQNKKNYDAVYQYVQNALAKIKRNQPVGPVSLSQEKLCNPYLAAETYDEFLRLFG